ncbi:MAG: hypothetical protein AAF741_10820 [Bacteroidota bacterium]
MNELEKYLRDNRDKALENRQPRSSDWERLQGRLQDAKRKKPLSKRWIGLLALLLLVGIAFAWLLPNDVEGQAPTPQSEADQSISDFDSNHGLSVNAQTPLDKNQSTKAELSSPDIGQPAGQPSLAESQESRPEQHFTPHVRQEPPNKVLENQSALSLIASSESVENQIAPKIHSPYLAVSRLPRPPIKPLATSSLSSLPTIDLPLPSFTQLKSVTQPRFQLSVRAEAGLLMGEGGVSAIAQPIETNPVPGQNILAQQLPNGTPVFVVAEGETVNLETSASLWYRANVGVIYRTRWRLGIELAYGSLTKQTLPSSFRSPDGRFYTAFARQEQAWLFGPSIEYISSINNWQWSVGLTGLVKSWSETTSNRQLLTPDELYSSLLIEEKQRVSQIVPVIDLRAAFPLTPSLSVGPSVSFLPLKRNNVFPSDWPDTQNWVAGQIHISIKW